MHAFVCVCTYYIFSCTQQVCAFIVVFSEWSELLNQVLISVLAQMTLACLSHLSSDFYIYVLQLSQQNVLCYT